MDKTVAFYMICFFVVCAYIITYTMRITPKRNKACAIVSYIYVGFTWLCIIILAILTLIA